MPRYYRRRYTRVVRPKKKWASNITLWNGDSITGPYVAILAQNKAQADAPTATILKCGNFKISADMTFYTSEDMTSANFVATCYILFVPEGIQNTAIPALVTTHPEYIMATKVAGGSFLSGRNFSFDTLNMSTRLKRNLNSGDKIVFCVIFSLAGAAVNGNMRLAGNCRYWTCAN